MPTWLHAARDFAREHRLSEGLTRALTAYGRGGDRAFDLDFHALERIVAARSDALYMRLVDGLNGQVDDHQARMFAERFRSVDRLLAEAADPGSRVLRAGLSERLHQVLAEGGPTRALRVRGVIDYVYSQAALHWHQRDGQAGPEIAAWALHASYEPVAPGVELARLQGVTRMGPQRVTVLRVAAGAAQLQVIDAWKRWGAATDIGQRVQQSGAIAAFSGGFFLYSEPDLDADCARHAPVGVLASAGQVHAPAVFTRAALVQDADGIGVRVLGLHDHQVQIGESGWRRPVSWVNRARASRASGISIVGSRVLAVGEDLSVPLNGVVLERADAPLNGARPGDRVRWRLPGVRAAVSGGPVLVRDGVVGFDLAAEDFAGTAPPRTFVDDETGHLNLLPRLAAGVDHDGCLLVAAVDGRDAEAALGLGLRSLGELMRALGAEQAMNLDGGSSKRLVVQGRIVDRPSVGVQGRGVAVAEVRPLHTAVLVHLSGA